jgi:hypothetical protein
VNHSEIVSFLWGVADLIRDTFKRGKYQDVILPLTVLRRLDCVLAPTKDKVLRKQAELRDRKLENLEPQLRKISGFAFYNTSRYDFEKLLADSTHLAANLRNYIAGFSANMREVLEKFDFDNTISKLDEAGLLFQVLERFKNVDLHPDKVDNPTMGMIFEELLRKFNEALDENPGEHFKRKGALSKKPFESWSESSRTRYLRTATSSSGPWTPRRRNPASSSRRPFGRGFSLPSPSATRRPPSAGIARGTQNRIRSSATRRASRWPKVSTRSSIGR